jgi:hypothetical protein
MKFEKGKSGNPNGRPPGVPNKITPIREELEKHGPVVVDVVVNAALDGDMVACKLVLERICPALRPIEISLTTPRQATPEEKMQRIRNIFGRGDEPPRQLGSTG